MRISRLIFAMPLLLAAGLPARAASSSAGADHVHVQITTMNADLDRPDTNRAALYFKLEPGWHIYWKNPGDAGEPPHIQWTLPKGIAAGPMHFPAPKRLPLGPLMDFGYEGEVLFPIDIDVAETVPLGPAMLHAHVNWLVCRERCIPGKAELEVRRTVVDRPSTGLHAAAPDSGIWKAFKAWPDSLPKGDKATFQSTKEGFRLSVETGQKETEATFIP